jgi:superfamily II DNA or RNA helicase
MLPKVGAVTPTLRDYQREAMAATMSAWGSGMKRPAAVLATGLGKTVIFAELSRTLAASGSRRPLVLVHRDELVRQSVAKLRAADPELKIGVIQGRECGIARTDVVVASVQTLIRRLDVIQPSRFDLGIIDECHHAAADSYVKIMTHFGAFDSASPSLWLGVTATMGRGDNRGLGDIWQDVVYERDIQFGVKNGFLVPAEVRTVRLAGLDTDKVRVSQGDLAPGALAKAMSSAHAGPTIARAYAEFARNPDGTLRRGIVFAPKVETAQAWASDFLGLGIRCAVITGETKPEDRQGVYRDLAAGRLDVIASVMVLTEGFDLPAVEVAVIGRPTRSMALLTQMVGRVLRPSPDTGKRAALVIDVVGAMGSGLARTLDLSIPEPDGQVAPTEDEVGERDDTFRLPEPEVEIPNFEFVALDLHGAPIEAAERKRGAVGPDWLRTYAGTPFLAATVEYPWTIYLGPGGTFWRKAKGKPAEQLALAEGQDIRSIHPGQKPGFPGMLATDKQADLLRRLRRPDGTPLLEAEAPRPYARTASELLAVHFASREIDGNGATDLSGQRRGSWLVLERAGSTPSRKTLWLCGCDCGRRDVVQSDNLQSGRSTACKSCRALASSAARGQAGVDR